MRATRLHLLLGLAVATTGSLAACGSNDEGPSTFPQGSDDGGTGGLDGTIALNPADTGPPIMVTDGGGNPIPASNISSLQFSPPSWAVTSDGRTPHSQGFTLTATLKSDGSTVNIDADSLAFNRPDLATLTGGNPALLTASGAIAGTGTLQAVYSGLTASATVTVSVALSQSSGTISSQAQAALDAVTGGGANGGTDGGGGSSDGGAGDGGDAGTALLTPDDKELTSILYPYDQTVFPLGIDSPLIMWNGPEATDTYKLHITENGYSFDYYTTAPVAAQVQFPQTVWDELTTSNTGDPVVMTLARYDGTNAYVSVVEQWPIAHDSLRGAIYYWAINGSTGSGQTDGEAHLARIRPGTGATPEYLAGGHCIGCHAVSSDGTTLVGAAEGGDTSGSAPGPNHDPTSQNKPPYGDVADGRSWNTYDVSGPTLPAAPTFSSKAFGGNLAVNNDGQYVVFGDEELHIASTADGGVIQDSGLETATFDGGAKALVGAMDPAFSPDGTKLAVISGKFDDIPAPPPLCPTANDFGCMDYLDNYYENLTGGSLQILDFAAATTTFANARLGVPQTAVQGQNGTVPQYMSYPSFAPDNNAIAFQVADSPDGCHDGSDCGPATQETGSVYLTKDNTATATRLATLSDPPLPADHNLTFEPTFNPIERGGYFWVVVSSSRAWGNKLPGGDTNVNKRLWVAAISPTGTGDLSHPAFFLQSQETSFGGGGDAGADAGSAPSINMRGFWTLSSCTASVTPGADAGSGVASCGAGFECCSGFCEQGVCVDSGSVSCVALGGSCTSTAQCCNGGSITCTGNVCTAQMIR